MKLIFALVVFAFASGFTAEAGILDIIKETISNIRPILEIFETIKNIKDFFVRILDFIESVTDKLKETFNKELAAALKFTNEDVNLNVTQLIRKYNCPVEEHTAKSDDGYILKLVRIPPRTQNASVVFLMHGLLDSSDGWVTSGPKRSLAYILHDEGYDVWMGNARGNKHSRRHVSKNPEQSEFWQFSWDEIGRLDLPAMIDYALAATGQKNLFYVGHSQGTTSFFVMASTRPEYNDKIRTMFALSPVAWTGRVPSPLIRMFTPKTKVMTKVLKSVGTNEFLPSENLLRAAGGFLCEKTAITDLVCSNPLFIAAGFNVARLNATLLPVYLGHLPAGCSTMELMHYGQGLQSKDFRRFDYEPLKNKEVYGTEVPPSYDMGMVKAKVALYYSANDWLAHVDDVRTLRDKLPNVVDFHLVADKKYNNMDFMLAKNAHEVVYNRIVSRMRNQN